MKSTLENKRKSLRLTTLGFTLIELLAVIVILAIIAVIATPIVLNIINEAKENAVLRSAEFYLDGVEAAIVSATLKNITITDDTYNILKNGNICLVKPVNNACQQDKILEVSVKGHKPKEGTITITGGTISNIDIVISDKNIGINSNTGKIEIKEDVVLAPGLYDENGVLVASWAQLNQIALSETGNKYNFADLIDIGVYESDEGDVVGHSGSIINSWVEARTLIMDESIEGIGDYAFSYCTGLTSIIIPEGVTSIGDFAFVHCSSLTSITIPEGVTSIGYSAFDGCSSLTSITIPEGVTEIGEGAFDGCSSLTSITIPEGVTSIGENTFSHCSSLISITIPEGVTSIGNYAFYDCSSLTSITIPEGVTEIGEGAFEYCSSLTTIYYNKDKLTGFPWGAPNATVIKS